MLTWVVLSHYQKNRATIKKSSVLAMEAAKMKHIAADRANLPIHRVNSKQNNCRIFLQLSICLEL